MAFYLLRATTRVFPASSGKCWKAFVQRPSHTWHGGPEASQRGLVKDGQALRALFLTSLSSVFLLEILLCSIQEYLPRDRRAFYVLGQIHSTYWATSKKQFRCVSTKNRFCQDVICTFGPHLLHRRLCYKTYPNRIYVCLTISNLGALLLKFPVMIPNLAT